MRMFRRPGRMMRRRLMRGFRRGARREGPPEKGFDYQAESKSTAKVAKLPPECPNCGGSVHPDELEWTDSHSAVCDYCGGIIQAAS
jgi:hypothetical protein